MSDANTPEPGRRRSRAILALIVGVVLFGFALFVVSLVERTEPVGRGTDSSLAVSGGG